MPVKWIDEALEFVKRCFEEHEGRFRYESHGSHRSREGSRGMVGAGILSLSLAGMHDTPIVHRAGKWLLRHPIERYGQTIGNDDRFHYGAFYCSQGMFQLGKPYWEKFYDRLVHSALGEATSGRSVAARDRSGCNVRQFLLNRVSHTCTLASLSSASNLPTVAVEDSMCLNASANFLSLGFCSTACDRTTLLRESRGSNSHYVDTKTRDK